jgi:hypothetical protein
MEFRWLIFLTLWTALSGPVLARPALKTRPGPDTVAAAASTRPAAALQ